MIDERLALIALLAGVMACGSTRALERMEDPDPVGSPGDDSYAKCYEKELAELPELLCELTGPPVETIGAVLVYSDDFSGAAPDPSKWILSKGYRGHGTILNSTSPENAKVGDGVLSIVTDRSDADPLHPFVSGYLDSLGRFARTYGRIEFRARFPYVPGVWFALWGRPWSGPFPELDIEVLNSVHNPRSELYFVNHWAAPPLPAAERRTFAKIDDVDLTAFHEYAIEWKPSSLEFSLDGVTKLRADPRGIPKVPVYWTINAWVGGWAGPPTKESPLPTTFQVDHMKVYRVDGLLADPEVIVPTARPSYSQTRDIDVAVANFDESCAHVTMYDGGKMRRTTSTAPYRFPVSQLVRGPHTLRFVATDGVRSAETTLAITVE